MTKTEPPQLAKGDEILVSANVFGDPHGSGACVMLAKNGQIGTVKSRAIGNLYWVRLNGRMEDELLSHPAQIAHTSTQQTKT